ncbi:sterol desaturase family protein [Novosphingobium sp. 9U]|uniref:sterol desaturase family protein n=1 Tax=Novosphingobium sp. 9U TaxID=2653158 RepID=UPI0012F39E29|nr:sterol desaturase family protein [Novosphingobium sp. 9U]VWX51116.1 Fatty acid hydroxylase [Novosphingobium sp. 9U]
MKPIGNRAHLFKSARLEKLTLLSPRTFVTVWALLLPTIAWVGWRDVTLWQGVGLLAAGLVAWTLFEYAMHRYPFHLEAEQPVLRRLVFLTHGNHHVSPNDRMRNLMPLLVSLPVSALAWATNLALLGSSGTWLFLGWITGYVIYDLVHYACHQRPMRGGFGAVLKRHHMRHHHVDERGNYAVSAIFWDRVFGSRISSLRELACLTSISEDQ